MREERDGREPFWLAVLVTTINGGIEFESGEAVSGAFDTEAEAVSCIKAAMREHAFEGFVYRCIPTVEIRRQPRITRLRRIDPMAMGAPA